MAGEAAGSGSNSEPTHLPRPVKRLGIRGANAWSLVDGRLVPECRLVVSDSSLASWSLLVRKMLRLYDFLMTATEEIA